MFMEKKNSELKRLNGVYDKLLSKVWTCTDSVRNESARLTIHLC